jgi:hypothetical protein
VARTFDSKNIGNAVMRLSNKAQSKRSALPLDVIQNLCASYDQVPSTQTNETFKNALLNLDRKCRWLTGRLTEEDQLRHNWSHRPINSQKLQHWQHQNTMTVRYTIIDMKYGIYEALLLNDKTARAAVQIHPWSRK